jgi:phospholipid transport system transporter-binding protein
MSADRFEATGDSQFRVTGRMTFQTAGELWHSSKSQLGGGQAKTVDLGAVTEVDSAGLALLLEWVNWSRQRGYELRFRGFPDKLRALARLSEVEALLGLGRPSSG